MIKLLSILIMAIYSILPDSPFQSNVDGVLYKLDFLPYLNWFVPFDNCLKITSTWLVCILVYYNFDLIKSFLMKLFVNKL